MRTEAARYTRYGDPADVLDVVEVEIGAPDEHEAIVTVEAAPIHNGDLYNIAGLEGFRLPLPGAPGIEGVGRIAALGTAGDGFKEGDRVVFHCSRTIPRRAISPALGSGMYASALPVWSRPPRARPCKWPIRSMR